MRCSLLRLVLLAWLVGAFAASGGMVELIDGTVHVGEVSLDGGLVVRGNPAAKIPLNNVLIARFSNGAAARTRPPGLVLTDGSEVAGTFSSATDSIISMEGKGLRVAGRDVAWAVYQSFDSALAADLPPGKTGALLAGGDFFEGTVKSADGKGAKVLNPIFGPRAFAADGKDLLAIILRPAVPQPAAFEVVTRDGSRYLALDVAFREAGSIVLRHPHYDGLRLSPAEVIEIRAAPFRVFNPANLKPTQAGESYATTRPDGTGFRLGAQEVTGCTLEGGGSATWKKTIRGGTFVGRVAATAGTDKLVFVVQADGRDIFRSPAVGPAEPVHLIRCTVPAAESFTLRVEGSAANSGLWMDPLIVLR
jgi:hypothetical protein